MFLSAEFDDVVEFVEEAPFDDPVHAARVTHRPNEQMTAMILVAAVPETNDLRMTHHLSRKP
jgi:hypothetical protein